MWELRVSEIEVKGKRCVCGLVQWKVKNEGTGDESALCMGNEWKVWTAAKIMELWRSVVKIPWAESEDSTAGIVAGQQSVNYCPKPNRQLVVSIAVHPSTGRGRVFPCRVFIIFFQWWMCQYVCCRGADTRLNDWELYEKQDSILRDGVDVSYAQGRGIRSFSARRRLGYWSRCRRSRRKYS